LLSSYEWEVVAVIQGRPTVVHCGLTDDDTIATRRVARALLSLPAGVRSEARVLECWHLNGTRGPRLRRGMLLASAFLAGSTVVWSPPLPDDAE
jgi:hypothetical protein